MNEQDRNSTGTGDIGTNLVVAVRRALGIFVEPGGVCELRVLGTRQRIISGYFDDLDAMSRAAIRHEKDGQGVYFTLNPCNAALLARSANRTKGYAEKTTGDADIERRCWILIDLDPVRPAGISSSEVEHEAALKRASDIAERLHGYGFPYPLRANSGNGAHLLYRIDLPNDQPSTELVQRFLGAVAFEFADEAIEVDRSVGNAARIVRLYGTLTRKGDSLPERPHRRSALTHVPETLDCVPIDVLEQYAARVPEVVESDAARSPRAASGFDLEEFIQDHNDIIRVASSGPWGGGGSKWILEACPFNPEHTDRAAYIVRNASGAIGAGCLHNSCRDKKWRDLRQLCDPQFTEGSDRTRPVNLSNPAKRTAPPWPKPLDEAAFHGPAGDFVRLIEPHTEADPAALLIQALVFFGSAIGRSAYFRAEADRHCPNLFVVIVGDTSKGRKGTSLGQVKTHFLGEGPDLILPPIASGLSSGEGLMHHVRDARWEEQPIKKQGRVTGYERVRVDEGVADKRLLVFEPELASTLQVMRREGSTLSAIVRQAWDTGDLRTLTRNCSLQATGAHISIIGHITRDELRRYLDRTEIGNGFANRFLYIASRRSKALPEGGDIQSVNFAPLRRAIAAARDNAKTRAELRRDTEARELWIEIYEVLSAGRAGLVGAVTSRAEAQVMRLALIYALLDGDDCIRRVHLEAALALWRYAEASAHHIFGEALGDPKADEALRLLQANSEGLTRAELGQHLFGKHGRGDLQRILDLLEDNGLAARTNEPTAGRSAERWRALSGVKGRKGPRLRCCWWLLPPPPLVPPRLTLRLLTPPCKKEGGAPPRPLIPSRATCCRAALVRLESRRRRWRGGSPNSSPA